MLVALVFGLFDAAKALEWTAMVPNWMDKRPGAGHGLGYTDGCYACDSCLR